MTETKHIFPKQPQSVTVLVFITVLIVLLLILTVMVHMRNRTEDVHRRNCISFVIQWLHRTGACNYEATRGQNGWKY